MFQWDKSIRSLGVPVEEVVQLYRSMRDVQLALPGLPAQEATAYLCQHQATQGIGTVAVFHLHKSSQLAFYVDDPIVVAAGKADRIFDQALMFVESMGFLMTDLDIHLLGETDRQLLWSSLPLQQGLPAAAGKSGQPPVAASPVPAAKPKPSLPEPSLVPDAAPKQAPEAAVVPAVKTELPPDRGEGNVDDLLAAVEALRTRRPGIRSRKKPPALDELLRRRQELREMIGRIWGSL